VKYALDAAVTYGVTGQFWNPLRYLVPSIESRFPGARGEVAYDGSWLPIVLVLWSLPFVWIGLTLTYRRVVDAGKSAWWSLLMAAPLAVGGAILGAVVGRSIAHAHSRARHGLEPICASHVLVPVLVCVNGNDAPGGPIRAHGRRRTLDV
jgi:uncharacterized membrane protein YhaH (DUF805 family)